MLVNLSLSVVELLILLFNCKKVGCGEFNNEKGQEYETKGIVGVIFVTTSSFCKIA
jgi:hypothetical protein